ncbi:ski oncogene-like isoform X2 [Ischnura elegans]|uniref:ski oncogene-like isoform X2 n=1 Tax=Ischnura elegans TaxID=197161 RepID=UPI001ED86D2A|nr:ski oncogene-like isoform X2 [Ischnura elegans]
MMETVVPYSPHLKKVLKTYQLSAVKSLSGPRSVLDSSAPMEATDKNPAATSRGGPPAFTVKREPGEEEAEVAASGGDPFLAPPPFPIQQRPILTTPDQSRSERSETILEGEAISCFVVGGEKRLCLPQILNSVLRDFSLAQINQVCDELQIFCSRCNPTQLEVLKVTSILPASAPSCGLITKTDAERLVSALLHRCPQKAPTTPPKARADAQLPTFRVYHECFGKCEGICNPQLYTSRDARCVECVECRGLFSPQRFVCHAHRPSENRTCHWGFDSSNWRAYLLLAKGQSERLSEALDAFKRLYRSGAPPSSPAEPCPAPPTGKRKQVDVIDSKDEIRKKAKYESPYGPYHLYATADPYHVHWYDTWPHLSPFSHWPSSFISKETKGLLLSQPMHRGALQPPTPPILRDSVAPSYLSHGPPVLLHPERVVPLSESERFERSFQPNVALAPTQRKRRGVLRPRSSNSPPQTPRSLPPTDEMLEVGEKAVIADESVSEAAQGTQSPSAAVSGDSSSPVQTRPLSTYSQSPICLQDSSLPEEGVSSEYKEAQQSEGDTDSSSEPEDPVAAVSAVLGEELAEGEVGQAVLQVVRHHWAKVTQGRMPAKERASKESREESVEVIQGKIAALEARLQSLREKLALMSVPPCSSSPPRIQSIAMSPHESLPSPVNAVIKTEPVSE